MKRLVNGQSNWSCYDIDRYWFVMMESIAQTCDALRLYRVLANRMALLFVCGEIGWMYLKKHIHESTFVSTIHPFWMVEYWQLKVCMHRVTWLQTSLGHHKRKSNIWISFIILFAIWRHLSILIVLWSHLQAPAKGIEEKRSKPRSHNWMSISLISSHEASSRFIVRLFSCVCVIVINISTWLKHDRMIFTHL